MKVLLLGSNGMLGQAINTVFTSSNIEVVTAARYNANYCFDFLSDGKLEQCLKDVCPDIVINTSAIVDLAFCEKDIGQAYLVNSRIPSMLAELCRKQGNYLVQISTDHYYVGDKNKKHLETDPIRLINEYARTKYCGELMTLVYENSLVIRTNIVGFRGNGKPTFIEWAISELKRDSEINLFSDFYTSSMHTVDFAKILIDVLSCRPRGVLNIASSDVVNKRDFIIGLSNTLFHRVPRYNDVSVNTINGAKRADSLGLDTSKAEKLLGYKMPGFKETLISIQNELALRRERNEI